MADFEQVSSRTCKCCGQAVAAQASAAASTSDAMLRLLRAAYEKAVQKGAGEIAVAHLVWCIAFGETEDIVFARAGLDRDDVLSFAYREMQRLPRSALKAQPAPSQELLRLLQRAQRLAAGQHRKDADVSHILEAFFEVFRATFQVTPAARRDQSAGTLRTISSSSLQQQLERPRDSEFGGRLSSGDSGAGHARQSRPQTQTAFGDRDYNALVERLARMERLVAGLQFERDQQAARADREREGGDNGHGHDSSRDQWRRRSRLRQRLKRRSFGALGHGNGQRRNGYAGGIAAANDEREVRLGRASRPPRASMQAYMSTPRPPRETERADYDAEDEMDGTGQRVKRFYLALDDEIVRAPSIGTRTAARLNDFGINLVRDLLNCDPSTIARQAGTRAMTAQRIADWQAQARLVCTVPWLRGTHAQLLVGAGYADAGTIAAASPSDVCAAILKFASTRDGQSVLRAGPPPDVERVLKWVEHSALAEPALAAA